MASPNILDIDAILAPISDDNPAGFDVREDYSPTSIYQTIKAERNSARAVERQMVHEGNSNEADNHWRKIASLAPQLLSQNGKDLEVACWLAESMIRLYGFQGLRDAFKILQGLVDQYWDNLYPMPDEDGLETRVSCVAGLNGEGVEGVLIAPIRKAKLTDGEDPGPYSLWQYQSVLEAQKIADEDARQSKLSKLGFSLDDVEKSIAQSSDGFLVALRDDIEEAIEIYRQLGYKLDELCGLNDSPPTRTVVEVLGDCLGAVNHLGRNFLVVETEDDLQQSEDSDVAINTQDATNGTPTKVSGPVATREQAFKQLLEISAFFRKTEPHSPVSYVLEKAVKWGEMPLNELILELIPDNSSRERFSELTGVKNDN
ncbi:type VI secretion system protein TssA [Teredinibacter waterburyi]|jgi:type VI secretion-associated protein, ImpA family|uniref:type VI secretion system protein TssA n=1 Tax=Teredinibacter waterburyi TaxID=1500538 RepID=UPI00165F0BF9|nr:type VI secretion system protein TssA [Teredinibacter waterburyi]